VSQTGPDTTRKRDTEEKKEGRQKDAQISSSLKKEDTAGRATRISSSPGKRPEGQSALSNQGSVANMSSRGKPVKKHAKDTTPEKKVIRQRNKETPGSNHLQRKKVKKAGKRRGRERRRAIKTIKPYDKIKGGVRRSVLGQTPPKGGSQEAKKRRRAQGRELIALSGFCCQKLRIGGGELGWWRSTKESRHDAEVDGGVRERKREA